jgi:hypothetical protein
VALQTVTRAPSRARRHQQRDGGDGETTVLAPCAVRPLPAIAGLFTLGLVSIGTSPTQKLHVAGNARITGTRLHLRHSIASDNLATALNVITAGQIAGELRLWAAAINKPT